MELDHILCAVDFSEASREALHLAAELARKTQAVLVLAYVEDRPLWMNEPYLHLPGDVREDIFARHEAQLAEWAHEARQRGASEVTTKLLTGVPWQEIVGAASEDPRIHMIVMGSHGRTGIKRVVLGSVAERVVRHAPCSVTVARSR